MSKRTKWGVGGGIVLAIVLIGALSAAKGRNKATEVRIEQVERRDLVASVTASGQVQPHTKVDLASDITGRIVRLAVKEGDRRDEGPVPSRDRSVAVSRLGRACRGRRCKLPLAGGDSAAEPAAGAPELQPAPRAEESEPDTRFRRTGRAAQDAGRSSRRRSSSRRTTESRRRRLRFATRRACWQRRRSSLRCPDR